MHLESYHIHLVYGGTPYRSTGHAVTVRTGMYRLASVLFYGTSQSRYVLARGLIWRMTWTVHTSMFQYVPSVLQIDRVVTKQIGS